MLVDLGIRVSGLVGVKIRFRKRKNSLLPAEVLVLIFGVSRE
jgi:hypothetical protein